VFSIYSRRTICPECDRRIGLDKVNFLPQFTCPFCESSIRVSDFDRRLCKGCSYFFGFLIPYLLGARPLWVFMVCAILSTAIVSFLWAYVIKYFVPPKLARCEDGYPSSTLGLGPR
jgi:hypothetical protein